MDWPNEVDTIKYDRQGGAKETGKKRPTVQKAFVGGIILSEINHLQKIFESLPWRCGKEQLHFPLVLEKWQKSVLKAGLIRPFQGAEAPSAL